MDYEKAYKEALERAKYLKENTDSVGALDISANFEYIFPELRESEDNKIAKELIRYLPYCDDISKDTKERCIAWLEKQGEQDQKHFELKAGHWYICHRAYCCRADHLTVKEGERFMCEKDGVVKGFVIKDPEKYFKEVCAPAPIEDEQKTTDKVGPKFKIGDWITNGEYTWNVTDIKPLDYVLQSQNGDVIDDTISYVDEEFHLWTIQDAKDGDVLATDKGGVFIYAKVLYNKPYAYCGVDKFGVFKDNCLEHNWSNSVDNIHPATKEQRDLLFSKMKEAGYEWDAEKKELKKIEQKPSWSEEDEKMCQETIDWFEKKCFPYALENENPARESIKWLKSLKSKKHWKPSEQNIKDLEWCADLVKDKMGAGFHRLQVFIDELKKL